MYDSIGEFFMAWWSHSFKEASWGNPLWTDTHIQPICLKDGVFLFGFASFDLAASDASTATSFSWISPPGRRLNSNAQSSCSERTFQLMIKVPGVLVIVVQMWCFLVLLQVDSQKQHLHPRNAWAHETLHGFTEAFHVTDPLGRSIDAGLPGPGTAPWYHVASAEHRTETTLPVALGFSSNCFVAGAIATVRLKMCEKYLIWGSLGAKNTVYFC